MPKIVYQGIRCISLTKKGLDEIQDMPRLTWDEVMRRADGLGQKNKTSGQKRR